MRERRDAYSVFMGNLRKDHLEDRGLGWRIILQLILKKWDGGMDWIDLPQDRDWWRALVNVVMNLWVS